MTTAAGVFRSYEAAREAVSALNHAGFPLSQINLLYPGSPKGKIHTIPTSETEPPGVGGAIGAVLGGTVGAVAGFEFGIAATALIPGVGPVVAVGVAAAVVLGAGGALGGGALGKAADEKSTEGVPSDEIFFYEDALRQGRSVVLVLAENHFEERHADKILAEAGAESIDAARKDWWLGLRDDEEEHYRALGHNFEQDQEIYRTGFEAALRRDCRGKEIGDETDCLKWWYPDVWDTEPFRHGYERGRRYWEDRVTTVPAGSR